VSLPFLSGVVGVATVDVVVSVTEFMSEQLPKIHQRNGTARRRERIRLGIHKTLT